MYVVIKINDCVLLLLEGSMLKYLANTEEGVAFAREVVPVHPGAPELVQRMIFGKCMIISDGSRNKEQCSNLSRIIVWNRLWSL